MAASPTCWSIPLRAAFDELEKTSAAISRRLAHETDRSQSRSLPFPDRWDPFFASSMSLLDVYAYPTLHFDFHAGQLSLEQPGPP